MRSPDTAAFDYEDEHGSSHIRPCPRCGAGTDDPCEDDCPLVTGIDAPTRDPSLDLKMMSGWPVAGVTLDPRPRMVAAGGSSMTDKSTPGSAAGWPFKHDDRWTLMTEFAVNLEARGGHRHGPNGLTYVSFGTATEVLAAVIKHRRREAHHHGALSPAAQSGTQRAAEPGWSDIERWQHELPCPVRVAHEAEQGAAAVRCKRCDREIPETDMKWKCCPAHTGMYDSAVMCEPCAKELHGESL